MSAQASNKLFIFGYGSIIWKQNFPFAAKYNTYITGYHRVFYQGSTDHRGVPGKPGRVVTLLPSTVPTSRVYGVSFEIADSDRASVLQNLDVREQGGYDRVELTLFDSQTNEPLPHKGLCYIANEHNEDFLGKASDQEIASQIVAAVGNSGPNIDYLLNLASSLRSLGTRDEHVFTIEAEAQKIIKAAS